MLEFCSTVVLCYVLVMIEVVKRNRVSWLCQCDGIDQDWKNEEGFHGSCDLWSWINIVYKKKTK
jgi:hypothetical protein